MISSVGASMLPDYFTTTSRWEIWVNGAMESLNVKEKANFTFIRKDTNPRNNDFIISRTGDLGEWSIHTAMVFEHPRSSE